jgi:catechol-2,3-dioxygenase
MEGLFHLGEGENLFAEENSMARINHVALKATDLEAATRFYENVFGFREVRTGRSRGHISWPRPMAVSISR